MHFGFGTGQLQFIWAWPAENQVFDDMDRVKPVS